MRISIPKFRCDIVLTDKDLSSLSEFFAKNREAYSSCAIVSNEDAYARYGQQILQIVQAQHFPIHPILLPRGENAKTLEAVSQCWNEMHGKGLDRKSIIIALGGGSITDAAGFAAACYMRGIDSINIPTTLLGMVDAAIGGKTGINIPSGKNLVGAFHHPRLILIAPHYLESLPEREFRSGLAEVIKAGIIWDADLVDFLEHFLPSVLAKDGEKIKTILARACKIKVEIIRMDEKEKSLRSILNYGHTFGHAIEALTHYTEYTHGEAVAIGMSCAAFTGLELGLTDSDFVRRQDALCQKAGLPTQLPKNIDLDALILQMLRDKKNIGGKIHLLVPRKIGKVDKICDVETTIIHRALSKKSSEN